MAQPPRLDAISLPWEQPVIYFVTLCVADRFAVLADGPVFEALTEITEQLRSWRVLADVLMPDHAHFVVASVADRNLSVGDFSNAIKRLLRQRLGHEWQWQRGCFDRLLRSDESLIEKWNYIRENPVRAGWVERAEDWPYFFGSAMTSDGKLAASPTITDFVVTSLDAVGEAVSFPSLNTAPQRDEKGGGGVPPGNDMLR